LTAPPAERKEALDSLLPFQREDFAGLFRVMDGLPVIIRLIDPPPHEFLPDPITLMQALFDLKLQLQHASKMNELNGLLEEIQKKEQLLKQATGMREANPMLGLRGGTPWDDAEAGFLIDYLERSILPENPFTTIDADGVGELMKIAVQKGRSQKPNLECGICGEHGGDPMSIDLCHQLGLTYVSCSPYRVPIARLAAAHAALKG